MSAFEYLLIFLSILLGLAVSDICVSLNRLLGAGTKVRWDWLAPMAAMVALAKIVTQWWVWFAASRLAKDVTFDMFFLLVVGGVLLFLMAAASLPDSVADAGVDLRAYYASASRRFWLLFCAQFLVINAFSTWIQIVALGARLGWQTLALVVIPAFAITLAFIRNRLIHALALAALLALYVVQFAGHRLGA